MWRDFQIAEFVSVGESFNAPRPYVARFWLTSVSTCETRSWRSVPQFDWGVQSPMYAPAVETASGEPAGPATAVNAPTTSAQANRRLLAFSIRSILLSL